MNTHEARIAAFHTSRANAARSAFRRAVEAGHAPDAGPAAAWAAVVVLHDAAAATPTDENSDAAEEAHAAANRAHPGFPG